MPGPQNSPDRKRCRGDEPRDDEPEFQEELDGHVSPESELEAAIPAEAEGIDDISHLHRFGLLRGKLGPVRYVDLSDIDDTDTSLQFRFRSEAKWLCESLASQGQLTPIALTVGPTGRAYRIIDGFCRVRAAKELGWSGLDAWLCPGMSEMELRRMAFVMNVSRRNLTPAERANAMHLARREGHPTEIIAGTFGVAKRTVERALALAEHILRVVDGKVVTMAHGQVLHEFDERVEGGLSPQAVEELAQEVQLRGLTAKQLRNRLAQKSGVGGERRDRRFAHVTEEMVRLYGAKLGPHSSRDDLEAAYRSVSAAATKLGEMLRKRLS